MKTAVVHLDLAGARGCAAFNLRRASRAVSMLYDDALAPSGLRATQFAILVAVARLQPASVGALAEVTISDQTTMTRNLRLMVREGLIEMSARGAKRMKLVRLTKKGERKLARAIPEWRAVQDRLVGAFGAHKWREVRRQLEVMAGLAVQGAGASDQHSKA
jgi:DNA-binding MarR family transcriptional regulator